MADHYRQGLMFEACVQGRHAALHWSFYIISSGGSPNEVGMGDLEVERVEGWRL
jgi:hypothetical protein